MPRRDRIDPETARLVEQRLQWLLQENGPDHRSATSPGGTDPGSGTSGRAGASRPPSHRVDRGQPEPLPGARSGERAAGSPPPTGARSRPTDPVRASGRRPRVAELPPTGAGLPGPGLLGPGLLGALTGFRRPHLLVVAVIIVLAILVAGWAVLRARPVAVAVTPPPATGPGTPPVGGSPAAPAGPAETSGPSAIASTAGVVVHVLGAVRRPGLVDLRSGDRVQDAIDAAGGLTGKADPGELNLAQAVTDGQQIVVGTKNKPAGEVRDGSASGGGSSGNGAGGGGSGGGGSGQPVNLNSASPAELEELPGVGPVMAGKIVAWRTENGRFSRIEELQEIDGVGPKTYAKLAPLCRV